MKKIYLTLLAVSAASITRAQVGDSSATLVGICIGIVFFLIVFLVLREVMLWYWKVNTIIKNQEEHNSLLRGIYNSLQEQKTNQEFINDIDGMSKSQ